MSTEPKRIVYLFRAYGNFYKVGQTSNLTARLSAMNTHNPGPVTLVHSIETDHPLVLEQHFHWLLRKFRHQGEWFKIPSNHPRLASITTIPSITNAEIQAIIERSRARKERLFRWKHRPRDLKTIDSTRIRSAGSSYVRNGSKEQSCGIGKTFEERPRYRLASDEAPWHRACNRRQNRCADR